MADPRARLVRIRDGLTPREWARAGGMTATIIGLNVLGWAMLAAALSGRYHITNKEIFGFGTGILAYTLGMRHAFDADHIAAIDNTTRKLVNDGKRPLSVGFFFSLGHSTIVFALAVLLNFGIRALDNQVKNGSSGLHNVTGIIGTSVSGGFLYVIAIMNLVILLGILRVFRDMRSGRYDDLELEAQLERRGLMNRFFGPLARRVDTPWKMYPVGALFGLGFDTASEVALLVLAGTAVVSGLPFYAILSLPILFAAGMCLLDTADGCFMNFAYDWAFARPVRKVYYNLTITGLSVFVAVFIGTTEILGLIGQEASLSGGFWDFMGNFDINTAGFVIVGVFVLTWAVALSVWHFGKIEQKWDLAAAQAAAREASLRRGLALAGGWIEDGGGVDRLGGGRVHDHRRGTLREIVLAVEFGRVVRAIPAGPQVNVVQVRTAVRAVASPVLVTRGAVVLHDEILLEERVVDDGAGRQFRLVSCERDRIAEGSRPARALVDLRVGDVIPGR
jgi:nickel/cobalt transporter (NiCoT) family protein